MKSDSVPTQSSTPGTSLATMNSPKSNNGGGVKRSGSYNKNQGITKEKKVPKWFKPGKPDPQ